MPEYYIRKPNTVCLICNKNIYKRPHEIKRGNGRNFCSKACFGKSCRKEISCAICGNLILGGLNKKTCSRACSNIQRTGIRYKQIGRLSKDKVKTAQSLKKRLLKIRGIKCERCTYNKVAILQVHHRDRNHGNNNFDNLELICPNCHYEEHNIRKR
jgi:hypothetical protein